MVPPVGNYELIVAADRRGAADRLAIRVKSSPRTGAEIPVVSKYFGCLHGRLEAVCPLVRTTDYWDDCGGYAAEK
jgi:hypothetical protein